MCLTVMAAVNVKRIFQYAREDKVEELQAEILEDGVLKEEIKFNFDWSGPLLVCRTLELCYNLSVWASAVA